MPGTEPSTPICWPNREALMSFLCVFLAQLETALSLKSCDSWLQVPDYGKVSHLHQGSPWCVQGISFWAIALSLPVGLCSWTGTGWQRKWEPSTAHGELQWCSHSPPQHCLPLTAGRAALCLHLQSSLASCEMKDERQQRNATLLAVSKTLHVSLLV